MRVFEFHFNPPGQKEIALGQAKLIFDSFCYEPENIYEKRMGSLYMVGVLKNVLPQNVRFLENLAKIIKERYYRLTLKNPEMALRESLKEANDFLEQIAKKGDVRWLGNLSFAVMSLKNFELNFTKVGELKIFLLRGKRVIDIDRKLKFEEITPWPLRIFGNIASGKLAEGDIILVSTKEITDFFEKENLLTEIAKLKVFDEKSLKEIFDKKKEEILKISGILLAIVVTKEFLMGKKEFISPKFYPKEFNLKQVFSPFAEFFRKLLKKPHFPQLKFKPLKSKWLTGWHLKLRVSKNLILISALIFLLVIGFLIFQREEREKLKGYQVTFSQIQEKVNQAESLLILKETRPEAREKANSLFKESWEEISSLVKLSPTLPKNFAKQVFSLKEEISKNLSQLNNLTEIEEPQLIFEFNPRQFIPQKMIFFDNEFYFFSPYSKNLFLLKEGGKGEIIETEQKINLATEFDDSILFFSKPNQLIVYRDLTPVNLKEPYPDFGFDDFSAFRENLYFLDKRAGQIIKYPYLGNFQWSEPELWLKKSTMGKSITIDGSVWILEKDNSISQYYGGNLREKLKIDIFPEIKDFSKIFTRPSLPYLYILEPLQNRIIVINKAGKVIKQFQSKKFDNLLDFAISEDGRTIYLLNGLKVYRLEI